MATLNANALTTLDRTKAELDIPLANTDFDDQVIQYINSVSDVIEEVSNRTFNSASYSHRFTGRGMNWLVAKEFPVTAITDVWVSQTYDFSTAELASTYTFQDDVFFVRLGESNFWPGAAPLSIKIDYTAGYTTIPDGIQQACIEWVRLLYNAQGDRRIGRTAKSKQGENISWENDMPLLVKSLLAPYQRAKVIERALSLNEVFIENRADETLSKL
jgi:hypothetical protein